MTEKYKYTYVNIYWKKILFDKLKI